MTAPRRVRSLLRPPCHGPWGRSTGSRGPGRIQVSRQTPRPKLHVRLRALRCGGRRLVGARFGRCDLTVVAVDMTKALAVCGIGAAVLWSGAAPVHADDTPAPPTTTTSDAPPPDPYAPPARSGKPKPAAPRRTYTPPARRTYTAPARRTYTAPASIARRPVVRTSRPKRQAKVVRRHRKQPIRKPAKAPPASAWLAPLPLVVAGARVPLPATSERDHPYLWLAGLAFAALAVAGSSLHRLSMRYYDPEVRLR
jgi:hypothetical protein